MKTYAICDFDGTITNHDTIDKFMEYFTNKEHVIKMNHLLETKQITSLQYLQHVSDTIYISELDNVISEYDINVDESFMWFVDECIKKNIHVIVLSWGFSTIIKKMLEKVGIYNIEIHAHDIISNKLLFNDEIEPKSNFIKTLKEKELCKIIYFGDGISDYSVIGNVDMLCVKQNSDLENKCKEVGCQYIQFKKFKDVCFL